MLFEAGRFWIVYGSKYEASLEQGNTPAMWSSSIFILPWTSRVAATLPALPTAASCKPQMHLRVCTVVKGIDRLDFS